MVVQDVKPSKFCFWSEKNAIDKSAPWWWIPECSITKSGNFSKVDISSIPTPFKFCPYCGREVRWLDFED